MNFRTLSKQISKVSIVILWTTTNPHYTGKVFLCLFKEFLLDIFDG